MRSSKKLLKKLDKYLPGISSFDTRIFNDEDQALVEIASSLILASEKKKKLEKTGSKTGRRQFSKLTKEEVLKSQNNKCYDCEKKLQTGMIDYHHIDGNSSNNHISNCQALCLDCHREKHRKN